jgi:chloramphenicol 3-O phosphotransferase
MAPRLIVITGPAAAGKSTLSRELQSRLTRDGDLWLVLELDVFARGLPRDWVSLGTHRGRHAESGFVYTRSDAGSIELAIGSDGRRVLSSFHRSVAAVAGSGVGVICETIVYDQDDRKDWSEALGDIQAFWVKLDAPLEVLEAREASDRTRVLRGLARGMLARAPVVRHDLEADSAAESASAIAQRILASMRSSQDARIEQGGTRR